MVKIMETGVNGIVHAPSSLLLDGYEAIQYCTYSDKAQTRYIEDNFLLFIRQGAINIRYGTQVYPVEKDQMVLLRKNILLEYTTGNSGIVRYIKICLKDDIVKEFVKRARLPLQQHDRPASIVVDMTGNRLSKFIDSLDPYFAEPEKSHGYLTKIKIMEMLFALSSTRSRVLSQLMDLREHFRADITTTVEENLMNAVSLDQLARLSGRSLSSFKRDFTAIYNMPPSRWVRQKRLEKARQLLLTTTMTVTDVCYTIGFENLAHFSRLFKARFGYCPSKSKPASCPVS